MENSVSKKSEKNIEDFYNVLLKKALKTIPEEGSCMVVGPMFIVRSPEENFKIFNIQQQKLRDKGLNVFNQIPFLDYYLEDPPRDYDAKFKIFYRGLIQSGKITDIYVLPDYKLSKGTLSEINYALESNINIHYLD